MDKITNKEVLVAIAISQNLGEPTERLCELMVIIARGMIYKKGFVSLLYDMQEDMMQEAIKAMLVSYKSFKPEKSDNAFAYLVQSANGGIITVAHRENKQKQIVEDYGNETSNNHS